MALKGSWSSPICISDDEDENSVAGQLTLPEIDSTPPNASPYPPQNLNVSHTPMEVETSSEPRSTLQKRKRDEGSIHPVPGPSRLRENFTRDSGPSGLETKKARKRRRRLEREEAMAHSRAQAFVPPFAFHPALGSWNTPGPAFNPFAFPMSTPQFASQPFMYPQNGGYSGLPYQSQTYHQPLGHGNGPLHNRQPEPSAWVSSMAATEPSTPALDFWDAYPSTPLPLLPPPPLAAPPPAPPVPRSATLDPSPLPPVANVPAPPPPSVKLAPPKKPISLIIGVNPDQDRHSKHGTFHHSIHTITSLTTNPASTEPYIPNPARTIVMEQLPKTHRTRDFIKTWSKAASGAHPVYFAVDPPSAKALIEFATAELARKAWGSPKLGGGLAGPPIKGKPRADLIRVWWYRVDGVGAGAGVGEIEEGEIEGDAEEREVSVPPEAVAKKETKKERKARLAREREAKMPKVASPAPSLHPSETFVKTTEEVAPEVPPYAIPALVDSYPILPDSPPPAYSDTVWPVDPAWTIDTASILRLAPSRSPLPPQSSLGTQWQAHIPARRSETGSSSEPGPTTATTFPPPLPAPHALLSSAPGFHSDGDVDMELDTPASATFPYALPAAPASNPSALDRAAIPPPPRPSAPSVSWPPPPSLSAPTPTPSPGAMESSPRASPVVPPLEPRAMKNAPKGPSFVKRSLVARHKELEERIARGKLELGLKTDLPATAPHTPPPASPSEPVTAASMEDNLRRLVLKSQKNKLISAVSVSTASDSTASSSAVASPVSAPASTPTAFSLDELAVSFITETIQTALSAPPPPPATARKPPMSVKQELAAKQKRLEAHIAESKTLMAQLTGARSKQEKDRILGVMRERGRYVPTLFWFLSFWRLLPRI
ncbi:hypothetical protein B0H15DRAFT_23822 [Mycena belliarum]|uniref:Uncharacterized protein n=1 Tax=Mycena belliarum TaxID=1033014 RepID=A0AAD6UJT5_9AGAR|nr:hypothetical protein B0H15DRAFT_23822 [Mycena belliae]